MIRQAAIIVCRLLYFIVESDFSINKKHRVFRKAGIAPCTYTSTPLFQYVSYIFSSGWYYAKTTQQNRFLWTSYIETINNHEISVIKTDDKAIKMTYPITEEKNLYLKFYYIIFG